MTDEPEDTLALRLRIERLEHALVEAARRLEALERAVGGMELEIRQLNEAEDLGATP